MILQYESTLEDHIEPAVRLFRRSKTYSRQRWSEAFWAGVMCGFVFLSLSFIFPQYSKIGAAVLGLVLGPVLVFMTFKDTTAKRIAKHIRNEIGSRLPTTTQYLVENGRLHYKSHGVEISFGLQDLSRISEDAQRIEFNFGDKGIALIPLRAFDNADHKQAFLDCIQKESTQAGLPSGGSCVRS